MIFYIFLAVLLYLTPTLSREISNEEMKHGRTMFYSTNYDKCRHLISEDTYQTMLDGSEFDSDESRAFIVCSAEALGWIVDSRINVVKMLEDLPVILGRQLTLQESIMMPKIFTSCQIEAGVDEIEVEILMRFGQCVFNRIQTDT
uniref:Venom protein Ci-23b n=1 Tax=Chelonus inanitus TaxID=49201 RepID=E6ZCJ2_9HYME|nr:venom protein Ci-23b [Chelonus inanitus]